MSLGNGDPSGSSALLRFIQQGHTFSGREPHCFYLNTGNGRFADVSASSFLNLTDDGRGVGTVDWDHDGDLDLWIINRNGPQVRFMENHLAQRNRFVSIRLCGTTCNRDAIGARVELKRKGDSASQVKTLRAGDGYLSQSSKWLHFGLGDDSDSLTAGLVAIVRWPDGTEDRFENLVPKRRYTLTQGEQPQSIETAAINLSSLNVPEKNLLRSKDADSIRVLSISGVPVPKFRYKAFTDQRTRLVFNLPSDNATLLCLFASWCPSCERQFVDLTKNKSKIDEARMKVVAVSVDHLDPASSSNDAVQDKLRKIGFSYSSGWANAEMVDKIQILNDFLFDLHLPIPVPTSLLIGADGRLVAIYKGFINSKQILEDVKYSRQNLTLRRSSSVPFAGIWHEPINRTSHVGLLDQLIQNGYLDEADDYVRRLTSARKQELMPAIVRLGMSLYRNGRHDQAAEHFKVAVRMDPSFVGVETELAKQRIKEGRPDSAIKLYREALRRSPDDVSSLNNLAWILATYPNASFRNGIEAVRLATKAVELTESSDPKIMDTLASSYAETRDFDAALHHANDAIRLARERGRIQFAEKLEERIVQFKRQQPVREKTD